MHPTTQIALASSRHADTLRRVDASRTRHELLAARRAARRASLVASLRATLTPTAPTAAPVCCTA
jgi:hypothetical protein